MGQVGDGDEHRLNARLASRLARLRAEHGFSLDELARRSDVSRSTLSRLERAEISPTAAVLGRLCSVYGRTMSRLLAEVESDALGVVALRDQVVWRDETSGFERRSVSPPHAGLRGEVMEGVLKPGADISYDAPPVAGVEEHIWILDGALEVMVDGRVHALVRGDCLRVRLWEASRFRCPGPAAARYVVFFVLP